MISKRSEGRAERQWPNDDADATAAGSGPAYFPPRKGLHRWPRNIDFLERARARRSGDKEMGQCPRFQQMSITRSARPRSSN